ncbi:MAG: aldo/keto reductase [Candidatus Hydrogenedentes bacterium]|nr:aldo/keto reductase [Candidatus Hydrogenedentota bacterium]
MLLRRREFLKLSAAAAAIAAMPIPATAKVVNGIPYRRLGKIGIEVSLLGIGGAHVGGEALPEAEAIKIMRTAVDEGINFFDNAWEYQAGRSEERMGKAMKDGYRDKVFLMTKVLGRSTENAEKQLEASLRRMQVDVIDLWQIHSVGTFDPDDKGKVYTKGVLDVALKAKEQGKIKHIGFTGHVDPEVHLAVLDGGFDWETIQMPINCLDPHRKSFIKNVIPKAQEYDLGIIAMKTLAGGGVLETKAINPEDALRFAMSMPVSVVVSGMDTFEKFQRNLAVARSFQQMDPGAVAALLDHTKSFGEQSQFENYKRKDKPVA